MSATAEPQFRRPDGAAIRMWREPAQNGYLSEREGRPIFDEVIYAEIIAPGSGNSIPVFELKRIFSTVAGDKPPMLGPKYEEMAQYVTRFESGEEAVGMAGTPLSEWPEISVSLAATLRAAGVFTVDALAVLPDSKLSIVGPDGRAYRDKAVAFLELASGNADYTALKADFERSQDEIKARDQQIAELNAKVDALLAAQQAAQNIQPDADPFAGVGESKPEKPTKGAKAPSDIV